MTDKELLKKLQNGSVFDNDDINFLLRQAERAQMLGEENENLREDMQGLRDANLKLTSKMDNLLEFSFKLEGQLVETSEKNKCYREAIEKAINETYEEYDTLWIVETLQKSLEDSE